MTGLHRLLIIAIAGLVVAGCGATTPTSTPAGTSAAALSSSDPTAAIESPRATAAQPTTQPSPACDALDDAFPEPSAHFRLKSPFGGGGSFVGLDVTRVRANADPAEFIEFKAREPYLDDPIRLVGNWQIMFSPEDELGDGTIELLGAHAVLRIAGREPIRMPANVGSDPESGEPAFLFDVPDVQGSAVIDFAVELSGECFTYEANGVWAFEVVRAAFADRCPSTSKEFAAHWAAVNDLPIRVAGVPVPLGRASTSGKWMPYNVSAQGVTGFTRWDPASDSAVGSAGETLRVAGGNADLTLQFLSTDFYRRGAIVDWIDGGEWPYRDRIAFHARADPYPDGHLELLLPRDPGRYVADFYFHYETPCATGDGVGAVAIDVE